MKEPQSLEDIELDLLLEAIYRRYHQDFRHYSRASVRRRVEQARRTLGVASASALQHLVLRDAAAFGRLLGLLTIRVSSMFRDPEFYRMLRGEVLPQLRRLPHIKVWVAGCSTGEEAFSLAVLLAEEGLIGRSFIYGTDIHEPSLEVARSGCLDAGQLELADRNHRLTDPPTPLAKHLVESDGVTSLTDRLRDRILFSDHSLSTDAVFSEVHLVTCRNVLIYFQRELQERVLHLFHEALAPGGFLGLGSSDGVRLPARSAGFEPLVPPQRIYRRA